MACRPRPGAAQEDEAAEWKNGVWRRDFEHGIALVNPTKQPVTVPLEPGLRHLRGIQAPAVNTGGPATSVTLEARDGIVLQRQ